MVKKDESGDEYEETVTENSFWYLSLDTPPPPLFKVPVHVLLLLTEIAVYSQNFMDIHVL